METRLTCVVNVCMFLPQSKPAKKILGPSVDTFEASRIIDSAKYQFWLKAVTKVGEGESTRTVTVLPTIKIPAQIVSFSQTLVTRWKRNVTLSCKRVGMPYPQPVWTKGGRSIVSSGRYQVTTRVILSHGTRWLMIIVRHVIVVPQINKDGSLDIHDAQHSDRGNYTCAVENVHGRDAIFYSVNVRGECTQAIRAPRVVKEIRAGFEGENLHKQCIFVPSDSVRSICFFFLHQVLNIIFLGGDSGSFQQLFGALRRVGILPDSLLEFSRCAWTMFKIRFPTLEKKKSHKSSNLVI